jgi:hypothetical protein
MTAPTTAAAHLQKQAAWLQRYPAVVLTIEVMPTNAERARIQSGAQRAPGQAVKDYPPASA